MDGREAWGQSQAEHMAFSLALAPCFPAMPPAPHRLADVTDLAVILQLWNMTVMQLKMQSEMQLEF